MWALFTNCVYAWRFEFPLKNLLRPVTVSSCSCLTRKVFICIHKFLWQYFLFLPLISHKKEVHRIRAHLYRIRHRKERNTWDYFFFLNILFFERNRQQFMTQVHSLCRELTNIIFIVWLFNGEQEEREKNDNNDY